MSVDVNALLIDLAHATDTLQTIRETALEVLPHTDRVPAVRDPLLDIVNAADVFLRLVPKEEARHGA